MIARKDDITWNREKLITVAYPSCKYGLGGDGALKRIKQVKLISGALSLNCLVAVCLRIGDAIYVSQALAGTTTIDTALSFIFGYWVTPIFFWSTFVYFGCRKLLKWTDNFI